MDESIKYGLTVGIIALVLGIIVRYVIFSEYTWFFILGTAIFSFLLNFLCHKKFGKS